MTHIKLFVSVELVMVTYRVRISRYGIALSTHGLGVAVMHTAMEFLTVGHKVKHRNTGALERYRLLLAHRCNC